MKKLLTLGLSLGVLLGALACKDDVITGVTGITPVITASLTTPNADDGALLIALTGPGIANVQPATSSYRLYWRLLAPDSALVILIGDIIAGPLFTASGEGERSDYAATVLQVARRDDAERASLVGYGVTVQ